MPMRFLTFVIVALYCSISLILYKKKSASAIKHNIIYGRMRDMSLQECLSQKAVDGTILLMMVDYGYLDMFINSYRVGELSQYKNLIVFCLEEQSYRV